ncbi:MAG: 4-(cytidine 5'-diphospho)-2-C-methyl-D-erythritol kinase [Rhodospirillales bacterium]|jgi:4-diphosphocytidyl-2-C-methyl-D-erythritol kinase|nr:4-(cytidine 5'-diphospho)-2-C-methyl-D-erythritol kinase [Rhodospirillales bacterium]
MTTGAVAQAVRVEARAKVNLYLHVTGRRADGYHLLDSLVVFPCIGDSVGVGPAEPVESSTDFPAVIARRQRQRSNPEASDLDRRAASRLAMTVAHSPSSPHSLRRSKAVVDPRDEPGGDEPEDHATVEAVPASAASAQDPVALSLTVSGPFAADVPDGSDNLVLRAARLLADAAAVPARARIHLVKRLPVASGIGGGSADAAATLQALARLWRLDPDAVDLPALALRLGADVPMCLAGRAVFIGGIGEEIAPAPPLPAFSLLLANPGVAVATPSVFAARRGGFSTPRRFAEPPADAEALAALLARAGNDLAEAAERLAPVIGDVLAALRAQPGALLSRMSGSGATCFALFASQVEADAARAALAADHPDWWLAAAPVEP